MGTLFTASSQAASLPIDQLVDGIQNLLTAPEETGLRLKRSPTGDWDRELDLESLGILFQIKYNDPAHPIKGGRAHVEFPGRRFFSNAPYDDVELDIEFNGGDIMTSGLFDMKVNYKFVQKFVFMADRPHEGYFELYRKLEGGLWKTKVTMDNNNMWPRPFLDITMESDRETQAHVILNYEQNKWEFKIEKVPGESITVGAKLNDAHYTGRAVIDKAAKKLSVMADMNGEDFLLNFVLNPSDNWGLHITGNVLGSVNVKWTMQEDFKKGVIVAKHNNKIIALIQLAGKAEMAGTIPVFFNYAIKYNINDGRTHIGKAKLKYDGKTAAKKLRLTGQPQNGKNFDYILEVDMSAGFKYISDLKIDGNSVEVWSGDYKWTNDENIFDLESTETFEQTPENPFYRINKYFVFFGRQ